VEIEDTEERVNRMVSEWIVRQYQGGGEKGGHNPHLRACPDAVTETLEGGDSSYGCTTGCEYVRLEAVIVCTHGERDDDYTYGEFGELPDIIADIESEEARRG